MKKSRKIHHAGRIVSLLIVLCMVLSIVPITAFTEEMSRVPENQKITTFEEGRTAKTSQPKAK